MIIIIIINTKTIYLQAKQLDITKQNWLLQYIHTNIYINKNNLTNNLAVVSFSFLLSLFPLSPHLFVFDDTDDDD